MLLRGVLLALAFGLIGVVARLLLGDPADVAVAAFATAAAGYFMGWVDRGGWLGRRRDR